MLINPDTSSVVELACRIDSRYCGNSFRMVLKDHDQYLKEPKGNISSIWICDGKPLQSSSGHVRIIHGTNGCLIWPATTSNSKFARLEGFFEGSRLLFRSWNRSSGGQQMENSFDQGFHPVWTKYISPQLWIPVHHSRVSNVQSARLSDGDVRE